MDLDSFLSTSRWDILKILAKKSSSPSEIASELNTSVSYISQQLKLLEAASLIKKERTGSVDKGQPRNLYSLSNELLYLTALSKEFSIKKLINMNEDHKAILRIWLIEDIYIQSIISKLYWSIHDDLEKIDIISYNSSPKPRLYVITGDKKIKARVESILKDSRLDLFTKDIPQDSLIIYGGKK